MNKKRRNPRSNFATKKEKHRTKKRRSKNSTPEEENKT